MSRYIKEYILNSDVNSVINFTNQFFMSNGFEYKNYRGEWVYQKGLGVLVGPKFVKIIVTNQSLRIEAWIKYGILPGVYAGELDLEGFVGIASKKPLKNIIMNFENQLLQMRCIPVSHNQYVQYNQQVPFVPQPPINQAYYHQNQPMNSASTPNASQRANFCLNCGNKLLPNSNFCNACGRKVN